MRTAFQEIVWMGKVAVWGKTEKGIEYMKIITRCLTINNCLVSAHYISGSAKGIEETVEHFLGFWESPASDFCLSGCFSWPNIISQIKNINQYNGFLKFYSLGLSSRLQIFNCIHYLVCAQVEEVNSFPIPRGCWEPNSDPLSGSWASASSHWAIQPPQSLRFKISTVGQISHYYISPLSSEKSRKCFL